MKYAVDGTRAYHGNGNIGSVGEDEGHITEPASSSEVLCYWHPMESLDSQMVSIEKKMSVPACPTRV